MFPRQVFPPPPKKRTSLYDSKSRRFFLAVPTSYNLIIAFSKPAEWIIYRLPGYLPGYKWRIRCVAPPKWKGFFSGAVSVPGLANGARALHDWAGPLGITISISISISATVTVPGVPVIFVGSTTTPGPGPADFTP